jgi:hypothetical protein
MFRTSYVYGKLSFAVAALFMALSASSAVAAPKLGVLDRPAWGGGMKVMQVLPGSAADEMGLMPGDVIISVNGMFVSDYGDISAALWGSSYAKVIWISYGQYFEGEAPLFGPVVEEYRLGGTGHAMPHKKVVRRLAIKKPH